MMKRWNVWRIGLVSGIVGLTLLRWRRRYLGRQGRQALGGYYDLMAGLYDLVAEAPYRVARREAVRRLALKPGERVLDLACGTGVNFSLLHATVGDAGLVIGVDYSQGMLDQARKKVAAHSWENVTLHRADAADLSPTWLAEHVPEVAGGVDAVLITLGLSVIPDWQAALRGAAAVLRPGGRLVVMDGKRPEGWKRLLQPAVWLIELVAGADTGRRPWEWMVEHLEDVQMDDRFLFGTIYIAVGRRPPRD
jgi:demethylmenaquinone methyltransferase/2-methoxy-6-polyprenyl-1,4-benzoquinol methylase